MSLFLLILLSAAPVAGQRGRTDGPPHYPTSTERLPATLPHTGVEVTRLAGTVFNDDPVLGRPGHLFIQGGLLWVTDQAGDPYLHLIELPSGRLLSSRGRDGEGPGDFRSVMQLSERPGDPAAIWAYDYSQRRLTRVPRSPIRGSSPSVISGNWEKGDSSLNQWNVLRMLWSDDEQILAIGHSDSNRIMIVDSTGKLLRMVAAPLLGAPVVSKPVREAVSRSLRVCTRPGSGEFVIAYSNASRADLFARDGRLAGSVRTPIPNRDEGDLHRDAKGVWHNPMPRYYYRSCATTADHIYLLFAGRLDTAGPEGTRKWDAQYVHVFDWDGALRRVYQLDQYAGAIAVAGDSVLYAAGGAMEAIYRYTLPRLTRGEGKRR